MAHITTDDVSAWLPPAPRRSYTGVPIGHGPIAEAAAEPVEFSRLIQALEGAHLVTHQDRWPTINDTAQTAPEVDANGRHTAHTDTTGAVLIRFIGCKGNCSQGDLECTRPDECFAVQELDGPDGPGAPEGAAIAALFVLAVLAVIGYLVLALVAPRV